MNELPNATRRRFLAATAATGTAALAGCGKVEIEGETTPAYDAELTHDETTCWFG